MKMFAKIGARFLRKWGLSCQVASVACSALCLALRPRCWPRTVREQVGRQILFTGIDALGLISVTAALAGVSVVTQAQLWLGKLGQSAMLGPLLVGVIVREIAPLLVSLVVIGRSGTAIATELANMRVRYEVNILESQGVDPTVYLVMPRVLGIVVSIFCLTIVFVAVSFGTGYLFGLLLDITQGDPRLFVDSILGSISPGDVANVLAKTIIPGFVIGAICCIEGLSVRRSVTEVPQAATRAVVRSIVAVLVISAIVSALTYA